MKRQSDYLHKHSQDRSLSMALKGQMLSGNYYLTKFLDRVFRER